MRNYDLRQFLYFLSPNIQTQPVIIQIAKQILLKGDFSEMGIMTDGLTK